MRGGELDSDSAECTVAEAATGDHLEHLWPLVRGTVNLGRRQTPDTRATPERARRRDSRSRERIPSACAGAFAYAVGEQRQITYKTLALFIYC